MMSTRDTTPLEVGLAWSRLLATRREVEEAIALNVDSPAVVASLLRRIGSLLEGTQAVEAAWRVSTESDRHEAARLRSANADAQALRGVLTSAHAEYNELAAAYDAAVADADDRIAKVAEAKAAEVRTWEAQYTADMKAFIRDKLMSVRQEAAEYTEATTRLVEREWRERLDDTTAAVRAAEREAALARGNREQAEAELRVAEAAVQLLEGELAAAKAGLSRQRTELQESRASGKALADEVLRLRSLLNAERTAHDGMARLTALRQRESEGAGAARASEEAADVHAAHQAELVSLRRVYESSVRSREEVLAEWRSKTVAALGRADRAEARLRDLDRR
jgi:hypothetical protein